MILPPVVRSGLHVLAGKSKAPLSLATKGERGRERSKRDLCLEYRTKHRGIVGALSKSKWT